MDLIDDPAPGENAPEFSVTEISGAVKRVVEGEFGHVRVRGEVGRVFAARSGHLYFDLKDDRNVLASVAWKGQVGRLTTKPEEGMEVVATGRMTTFGAQSKYQLNVDDVRPAGVGALMAMLEKRKKLLAAEGLFDADRKRPLPYLPEVVGVITSPSGAVIRDILHRLGERFPRHVLVWPVAVQGQACAPEVATAIEGFNRLAPDGPLPRPDLLIVARGGGSIEDLWGFNEEIVARAAAASDIPLISAVGHETDTTLIDHVADRRAPTPTAAAEIAVPVRMELLSHVEGQGARLTRALGLAVERRRQRLSDMVRALPRPEVLTGTAQQRLDTAALGLDRAVVGLTERQRARLDRTAAVLRPAALSARLAEARRRVESAGARLDPALTQTIRAHRRTLHQVAARLSPQMVRRGVSQGRRDLSRATEGAVDAYARRLGRARERLDALDRLRRTLDYTATLARGFAVVRSEGAVITTRGAAERAGVLEIEFQDGRLAVGGSAKRRKATGKSDPPPDQGTLF